MTPSGSQRSYAYTYGGAGCAGTLWTAKARYAWVDLSAGPVAYGPLPPSFPPFSVSPGVVSPHTFPSPPSARSPHSLAASLLGLVRSAAFRLAAPPASRHPLPAWPVTHVVIFTLTPGAGVEDTDGSDAAELASTANWLSSSLNAASLGAAAVRVTLRQVHLASCALCSAALAGAERRSVDASTGDVTTFVDAQALHSSLLRLFPPAGGTSQTDGFDASPFSLPAPPSALLPPHLRHNSGPARSIPVFLFEVDNAGASRSGVLFGCGRSAVPFRDSVVALRTRRATASRDGGDRGEETHRRGGAACAVGPAAAEEAFGSSEAGDASSQPSSASSRSSPRPASASDRASLPRSLLSALLTAGWGVSPPHEAWASSMQPSPDDRSRFRRRAAPRGRPDDDHTWGVGASPWGPVGTAQNMSVAGSGDGARHSPALPFWARDAAQRHAAVSAASAASSDASAALERLLRGPVNGAAARLPPAAAAAARARAAVLLHKLRRCGDALGAHDFDGAVYYGRSARWDAAALAAEVAAGMAATGARLECGAGGGGVWGALFGEGSAQRGMFVAGGGRGRAAAVVAAAAAAGGGGALLALYVARAARRGKGD